MRCPLCAPVSGAYPHMHHMFASAPSIVLCVNVCAETRPFRPFCCNSFGSGSVGTRTANSDRYYKHAHRELVLLCLHYCSPVCATLPTASTHYCLCAVSMGQLVLVISMWYELSRQPTLQQITHVWRRMLPHLLTASDGATTVVRACKHGIVADAAAVSSVCEQLACCL